MVDGMTILAASDFDVIIGIIFLLFWAVAAIAGKLKGQNKNAPPPTADQHQPPGESPLERMQREIAEQLRQMHGDALPPRQAPPPLPPTMEQRPTARQTPPARQQPPARQLPPRRQPVQRREPKRPRPVQVFAEAPPPAVAPVVVPAAPPPAPARPVSVTAPVIRRWLRPATLRQQFILTELFQPPMSMREDRRFS